MMMKKGEKREMIKKKEYFNLFDLQHLRDPNLVTPPQVKRNGGLIRKITFHVRKNSLAR